MSDEFFIGWNPKTPKRQSAFLRSKVILIFAIIPLIVWAFVYAQKPFNDHQFELGHISSLSGQLFLSPVPHLLADEGQMPDGMNAEVLLVAYGKFGAETVIEPLYQKNQLGEGDRVRLNGTLIHGDGKTLMELTHGELSIEKLESTSNLPQYPSMVNAQTVALEGEILDPKCYFGVMKPGEGKIHKSCAVRCISGGIPPVFRVAKNDERTEWDYYLLLGEDEQRINEAVLPVVGETISLQGKISSIPGWKVLLVQNPQFNAIQ